MNTRPLFQHRHYVKIASIISLWPEPDRDALAVLFAAELAGTNSSFDADRFIAPAKGKPTTGRDK